MSDQVGPHVEASVAQLALERLLARVYPHVVDESGARGERLEALRALKRLAIAIDNRLVHLRAMCVHVLEQAALAPEQLTALVALERLGQHVIDIGISIACRQVVFAAAQIVLED